MFVHIYYDVLFDTNFTIVYFADGIKVLQFDSNLKLVGTSTKSFTRCAAVVWEEVVFTTLYSSPVETAVWLYSSLDISLSPALSHNASPIIAHLPLFDINLVKF